MYFGIYIIINFYHFQQYCSISLYFNPINQVCDYLPNVDCGKDKFLIIWSNLSPSIRSYLNNCIFISILGDRVSPNSEHMLTFEFLLFKTVLIFTV